MAALAALVAAVLALVLFFPPPGGSFHPTAWSPGPGFSVDEAKVDRDLAGTTTPYVGEAVRGPEDIEIDEHGRPYTGTQDGKIVRVLPSGDTEVLAEVGGRPLGLAFGHGGDLLVANHGIGLQSVSPQGEVAVLTTRAGGRAIRSANDVAVGSDGTVYLSDSNPKYNSTEIPGLASYSLYDFLEGRAAGRVIAYDPTSGQSTELVTDLHFPNGILLSEDETALLVTESTRYRISRHWIAGDRAGERETFLDDVPGILDGITRDESGLIHLPMYDRVDALDRFVLPGTLLRHVTVRLPPAVLGAREPLSGSILTVDAEGETVRQLTGFHPAVSNIALLDGAYLLGTLEGAGLRTVTVPHRSSAAAAGSGHTTCSSAHLWVPWPHGSAPA
nr:SMP-30/gluconolactonase/LRE family protein [Isoptericola halotolerans]